jgi:hypothetical protein
MGNANRNAKCVKMDNAKLPKVQRMTRTYLPTSHRKTTKVTVTKIILVKTMTCLASLQTMAIQILKTAVLTACPANSQLKKNSIQNQVI